VVFTHPPLDQCGGVPAGDLVKRVIALPGQTIYSAGKPDPVPPGYVAADLIHGLDRAVEGEIRQRAARLGHRQHEVGGARLQQRGGLAHGGVADAHAQPPHPRRGGERLIAGADQRPGPGGRGRPAEAVHAAVRTDRPRATDELPGDQERDQDVGQPAELTAPADQVLLPAAERTARARLEHADVAGEEPFKDPIARLVMHNQVGHAAAARRRVFGIADRVQVQLPAVAQLHGAGQGRLHAVGDDDAVLVPQPEPVHVPRLSADRPAD
jgi:hypothetical protein